MVRVLIVIIFFGVFFIGRSQETKMTISGKVTYMGQALPNVNVVIKGTTDGTKTNAKGKYSIEVYPGNILVFTYLGMQTIEVAVDDTNNVLDLKLSEHVVELDEVVIKKRKRKSQKELLADYPTNTNLIKSSWGIMDKDRTSYSIRVIDGKNLMPAGLDFLDALLVWVPNMVIDRVTNPLDPRAYLPQYGSTQGPAIFDVDGFVYEQAPTFISVHEIERVAVLTRNGAFARYGPRGAGGVIIINTKEQTRIDDLGVERHYNNSGLRDSIYDQFAIKQVYVPEIPEYIEEYSLADSEEKANQIFENQKTRFNNSPYYLLELSQYFKDTWGDTKKSLALLDTMTRKFAHDAMALKALAYRYEKLGSLESALQQYLKVLKLRPRDAQSHRDLANAYDEIGNYQKALHIYSRYELAVDDLDSVPFYKYGTDALMTTERMNIIKLNAGKFFLESGSLEESTSNPESRVLFEWNNNAAEFELQFVDPEKYYDGWEYTVETKETELSAAILKGYSSKQFFLDDNLKGEWVVNISYFGNGTQDPTYLKVTTFFDYGTSAQRKAVKVFKLAGISEDSYLCRINTDSKLFIE
ncbi:tetratricopeptide repeat protein [Arenibacter sp. N53]|uniref:carboxypeptidase-like regulatory domain-containing protein n=1 Tax=Arenibacter TaxID=178469 RepID=UPI000CD3B636|nr:MULTISPECIES: carboxypeptidase-like regulatory domain-containing protein [Arenibacter]MCM4153057.1 tetratricopeptide repeat protein [Arenibacter sp. N53]